MDPASGIQDPGCVIPDAGSWIQDPGPRRIYLAVQGAQQTYNWSYKCGNWIYKSANWGYKSAY